MLAVWDGGEFLNYAQINLQSRFYCVSTAELYLGKKGIMVSFFSRELVNFLMNRVA